MNEFENVSLFVIGTELTRGIIKDSHIPLLTSELTSLGYAVKRAVIVPDDGTIENSLEEACGDSSCILVTGGLGPTSDDMTRRIIASLASTELEINKQAWDTLYKRVGERIYGANEQQARIPVGFDIIENPNGTAPGFKGFFEKNGKKIFIAAMPGPPAEMQPMFFNYVKPFMASLIGTVIQQRDEYSVYMIAEAKLEELCRMCAMDDIQWGTRFQQFKISLYISGSDAQTRKLYIEKLRKLAGFGLIVDGDDKESSALYANLLKESGKTVSCAESCTSGLVAKMLTDMPGSSRWFWGGAVTYDNNAKIKILGVKPETIEKYGAVSTETAAEMAEGILKISGTDYSVSITGVAGPDGGTDEKPNGTVCFGFASKERKTQTVCIKLFWHGRDGARRRFATAAFILARLYAQGFDVVDIAKTWLYI